MNRIRAIKSDITTIRADAIVNAANSSLMGGGGVDGAIHKAGGKKILDECKKIIARQGGCCAGEAVITSAGNLPAKYVIHTVGPVWRGGMAQESEILESCYTNALKLAVLHHCNVVAFPAISTGVFGFPKDLASGIAVSAVSKFLQTNRTIREIILVSFDDESHRLVTEKILQYNHTAGCNKK